MEATKSPEQPDVAGPRWVLEEPDSVRSREALVALAVTALATALAYSNTFDASFHFDDIPNIVRNESLRDLRRLWPPSGTRYLGYLSFALNYRFGGLAVFGYHLANLIIHLCNGLLVFWLTATTLRTPAVQRAEAGPLVRRYLPVAAGLLFAVHPVATQAVTYIVQRFASLATLFFLLSLVLYARARLSLEAVRPSRVRAACFSCLSVIAAVAAMKTKEISFTLPFVAAGYELLFFRSWRRLLLLVPLAATALLVPVGWVAQAEKLVGDSSHFAAEAPEIPRSVYLLTQSRVVVTYLRLLLLPVRQNLDYDVRVSRSLGDPRVLFALAVLLAVVAVAVFLLRRARHTNRALGILVFFGIAWFFVTVSVESSVIPIRDVIFEHRMYLPSAGAAVAMGTVLLWAVERLRLRISLGLQCAAALLMTAGPLAVATYARNLVWKDELTLWSDVAAKSPEKSRPHNLLGLAYQAKGLLDEAVSEYREAIRLDPSNAAAHQNLGDAFKAKGQFDDAERELLVAVKIRHWDPEARLNLGNVYWAKGRLDDAVREYRTAVQLDPRMAKAHDSLGVAYQAKGQLDDAVREYREGIRLAPWVPDTHFNLGAAYEAKGQLDDAVREYREAIRIAPSMAKAHNNLGNAYEAKREFDDAVREYREAIRIDPGLAEAHSNLGRILLKQGRAADAVEEVRRAFELRPTPETVFRLAFALEAADRASEAIAQYQRFIDEAAQRYPDRAESARARIVRLRASLERNRR